MSSKPLPKVTPRKPAPTFGGEAAGGGGGGRGRGDNREYDGSKDTMLSTASAATIGSLNRSPNLSSYDEAQQQSPPTAGTSPSSPAPLLCAPDEQENRGPVQPPSVPLKPYPPRLTLRPRDPSSSSSSNGLGLVMPDRSHPLSPFTVSFDAADNALLGTPNKATAVKKPIVAQSSDIVTDFTSSDPQFFPRKYRRDQRAGPSSRPDSQFSTYTASSARAAVVQTASRQKLQKVSATFGGNRQPKQGPVQRYSSEDGAELQAGSQYSAGEQEDEDEDGQEEVSSGRNHSSGSEYDPDERTEIEARGLATSSSSGKERSGHRNVESGRKPPIKRAGSVSIISPRRGDSLEAAVKAKSPVTPQIRLSPRAPKLLPFDPTELPGTAPMEDSAAAHPPPSPATVSDSRTSGPSWNNRRSASSKANSVLSIRLPASSSPRRRKGVSRGVRGPDKPMRSASASIFSIEDLVAPDQFLSGQWAESESKVRRSQKSDQVRAEQTEQEDDPEDVNLSKLAAFCFPHANGDVSAAEDLSNLKASAGETRRMRWKEAIALAQQKERETTSHGSSEGSPFGRLHAQEAADGDAVEQRTSLFLAGPNGQIRPIASIPSASLYEDRVSDAASLNSVFNKGSPASTLASRSAAITKVALLDKLVTSQAAAEVAASFSRDAIFASIEDFESAKRELKRLEDRLVDKKNKLRTMKRLRGARGKLARAAGSDRTVGAMSTSGSQESNIAALPTRSRSNTLNVTSPGALAAASSGSLFPLIPPAPRFSHSHNASQSSNASLSSAVTTTLPHSRFGIGSSNEALDVATVQVDQIVDEVLFIQERVAALKSRIREHIAWVLIKRCEEVENVMRSRDLVYITEDPTQEDEDEEDLEADMGSDNQEDERPQGHLRNVAEQPQPSQMNVNSLTQKDERRVLHSHAEELRLSKVSEAQALQQVDELTRNFNLLKAEYEDRSSKEGNGLKRATDALSARDTIAAETAETLRLLQLQHVQLTSKHQALQDQLKMAVVRQQDASAVTEELGQLQALHTKLSIEHQSLQSQHADLTARHQDLSVLHDNKLDFRALDQTSTREADDVLWRQRESEMTAKHEAALSKTRQSLDDHNAEAAASRIKLATVDTQLAASNVALVDALAQISRLEADAQAHTDAEAQERFNFRSQLQAAVSRASDAESEVAALQSELDTHRLRQTDILSQSAALQKEITAQKLAYSQQADEALSAKAQHDTLELAVAAERRIMAERDALFHAFEARLERAEEVLREQDKRCAALLGKAEGREELDDFLAKIKGGTSKKADKTAGQDIDALLRSLGEHVEDLADEMDRTGKGRSASSTSQSKADGFVGREVMGEGHGGGRERSGLVEELELQLDESQYQVTKLRAELQSSRLQLEAMSVSVSNQQDAQHCELLHFDKSERTSDLEAKVADLEHELASVRPSLASSTDRRRVESPVDSVGDVTDPSVKVAGSDHEGDIRKRPSARSEPPAEGLRNVFTTLQGMLPSTLNANLAQGNDLKALQSVLEAPEYQSKLTGSPTKSLGRATGLYEQAVWPADKAARPGFGATKTGSVRDLVRNFSSNESGGVLVNSPTWKGPATAASSVATNTSDAQLTAVLDQVRLLLMTAKAVTQKALTYEVVRQNSQDRSDQSLVEGQDYCQAADGRTSWRRDGRQCDDDIAMRLNLPGHAASPRASSSSSQSPTNTLSRRRASGLKLEPLPSRSVDSALDPFGDSAVPSLTGGLWTPQHPSSAPSTASRRTTSRSRLKPLSSAAFLSTAGYGTGASTLIVSMPSSTVNSPTQSLKPLPVTPFEHQTLAGDSKDFLTPPSIGLGRPSSAASSATTMRRSASEKPATSGKSFESEMPSSALATSFGSGVHAVPQRSITLGLSTSQLVSRIRSLESEASTHSQSQTTLKRSAEQVLLLEKTLDVKDEEVRRLRDEVERVREEEGVQKAKLLEELNKLQKEIASKSSGGNALLKAPSPVGTTGSSTIAQTVRAASPFAGWISGSAGGGATAATKGKE